MTPVHVDEGVAFYENIIRAGSGGSTAQMKQQSLLIVEDDTNIRELLTYNLQREGYSTLEADNGLQGLAMARTHKPDLILLDVMLPGMDGFQICRELERDAATAAIPILILTARGDEVDRIVGLELGAADYVAKPFSVRELLLRVRAVLRRQEPGAATAHLQRHNIEVNGEAHRVTVAGEAIELTATEFRLLEDLMSHAGAVRTREQLLNNVWGYQFEGYARTVDTHVRRLRTKLGESAEMVETVRGVGYRFRQ